MSEVLDDWEDVGAATRLRAQRLLDQYEYVASRRLAPAGARAGPRVIELVVTNQGCPYCVEVMRGVASCLMDVVSRKADSSQASWATPGDLASR